MIKRLLLILGCLLYTSNLIRERSGLNKLEDAYPEVKGNKNLLRELIQKERMVELAFETLRLSDLRRWMTAKDVLNGKVWTRNVAAKNYEDSWHRTKSVSYTHLKDTQVRYWAIPGIEGFAHRLGGREKDYDTSAISTDPINHQKMVTTRQAKIDKIADFIPELEVLGDPDADLLSLIHI